MRVGIAFVNKLGNIVCRLS